jgi:peptide deformylase
MAHRPICLFPDPVLSRPARTIREISPSIKSLIQDLVDTLYSSPGVGLAAPQIGESQRVAVIDVSRKPKGKKGGKDRDNHGLLILINPVLFSGTGVQVPREGCLSVPDLLANVRRYQDVTVRYLSVEGEEKLIKSSGFEALALQHEIDHLDGKLFLDRVLSLKTDVFRRKRY